MANPHQLPRVLVMDDMFGRTLVSGGNPDRENLCAHLLLRDVTGDSATRQSRDRVLTPTAEAVFCRAQTPVSAGVGDWVENDLGLALDVVRRGWRPGHPRWAMALLDLCFYTGRVTDASQTAAPGMPEGRAADDEPSGYFGLVLLDAIAHEMPELPVFILSSKSRDEVSLEFSRRGALGFIARDDLRGPELLQDALWQHGLLTDVDGQVVGNSLAILLALREGRRAARHRQNVLIRGERGTGKELLARYVHRAAPETSGGATRPFVVVNSAVLTPNLFASELFGIEPRTATGVDGKLGVIEMAHHGDLFLDEIADMPGEVQAAVLRVLQERQITRVGARQSKEVDVRFLSATNIDLEEVERGFRSDLLDRLCLGGTIWLPPLRERRADIPALAEAAVREAEALRPDAVPRDLTPEALDLLNAHDWPGNVRELRSVIFEAVNGFPNVEHLVPGHLRLTTATGTDRGEAEKPQPRASAFERLLEDMSAVEFRFSDVGLWAGRLGLYQRAQAQFLARYLGAALHATKRRTPDRPDGVLQIHPAVKLLTGDSSLSASKAADIVKRLLGPFAAELDGDLAEAYAIAIRLRPKAPVPAARSRADR